MIAPITLVINYFPYTVRLGFDGSVNKIFSISMTVSIMRAAYSSQAYLSIICSFACLKSSQRMLWNKLSIIIRSGLHAGLTKLEYPTASYIINLTRPPPLKKLASTPPPQRRKRAGFFVFASTFISQFPSLPKLPPPNNFSDDGFLAKISNS